ncbi:MAG: hypothetical protein JNL58_01915 [Planctomyces sp.]|nr:hypothetical protein [Planctomyces sp.]
MNIEQLEQKIRSLPLRTPSSDLDESLAELFHSENLPTTSVPVQSGSKPVQSGTHRFVWIAASLLAGLVAGFVIGSQQSDGLSAQAGGLSAQAGGQPGGQFAGSGGTGSRGPENQGLTGAAMGAESLEDRRNPTEIASNGASTGVGRDPQTAIFPETGFAEGIPTSIFLEAEKRGIARTAAARAAFWQEKTGESFDVRSHLADGRFDFCRLCHLADGS